MSRYTRTYDTSTRTYDAPRRTHDTTRNYDVGLGSGSTGSRFGLSSGRTYDLATRSYDTGRKTYDTGTRKHDTNTAIGDNIRTRLALAAKSSRYDAADPHSDAVKTEANSTSTVDKHTGGSGGVSGSSLHTTRRRFGEKDSKNSTVADEASDRKHLKTDENSEISKSEHVSRDSGVSQKQEVLHDSKHGDGPDVLSNFRRAYHRHATTETKDKTHGDKHSHGDTDVSSASQSSLQRRSRREDNVASDSKADSHSKHRENESIKLSSRTPLRGSRHKHEFTDHTDKSDQSSLHPAKRRPDSLTADSNVSHKTGHYTRSKTTDVSSLLGVDSSDKSAVDDLPPQSVDDSSVTSVGNTLSMDELAQLTRAERIARYKEERKRQLASLAQTFSDSPAPSSHTLIPSLFTSSRQAKEGKPEDGDSPLSRSRSLRDDLTKSQTSSANVSRSKSLRAETDTSRMDYGVSQPELQSVELGNEHGDVGVTDVHRDLPADIRSKIRAVADIHSSSAIDRLVALRKKVDMGKSENTEEELESLREKSEKRRSRTDFYPEPSDFGTGKHTSYELDRRGGSKDKEIASPKSQHSQSQQGVSKSTAFTGKVEIAKPVKHVEVKSPELHEFPASFARPIGLPERADQRHLKDLDHGLLVAPVQHSRTTPTEISPKGISYESDSWSAGVQGQTSIHKPQVGAFGKGGQEEPQQVNTDSRHSREKGSRREHEDYTVTPATKGHSQETEPLQGRQQGHLESRRHEQEQVRERPRSVIETVDHHTAQGDASLGEKGVADGHSPATIEKLIALKRKVDQARGVRTDDNLEKRFSKELESLHTPSRTVDVTETVSHAPVSSHTLTSGETQVSKISASVHSVSLVAADEETKVPKRRRQLPSIDAMLGTKEGTVQKSPGSEQVVPSQSHVNRRMAGGSRTASSGSESEKSPAPQGRIKRSPAFRVSADSASRKEDFRKEVSEASRKGVSDSMKVGESKSSVRKGVIELSSKTDTLRREWDGARPPSSPISRRSPEKTKIPTPGRPCPEDGRVTPGRKMPESPHTKSTSVKKQDLKKTEDKVPKRVSPPKETSAVKPDKALTQSSITEKTVSSKVDERGTKHSSPTKESLSDASQVSKIHSLTLKQEKTEDKDQKKISSKQMVTQTDTLKKESKQPSPWQQVRKESAEESMSVVEEKAVVEPAVASISLKQEVEKTRVSEEKQKRIVAKKENATEKDSKPQEVQRQSSLEIKLQKDKVEEAKPVQQKPPLTQWQQARQDDLSSVKAISSPKESIISPTRAETEKILQVEKLPPPKEVTVQTISPPLEVTMTQPEQKISVRMQEVSVEKKSPSEGMKLKEPEKVIVKEPEKVIVKEPLKVIVKEPEKVIVKEPEKVIVKEPLKVIVKAPEKVTVKEPVKVEVKETEKKVKEQVSATMKEPVKMKEPDKVTVKEPVKVTAKEPEKLSMKEHEKVRTQDQENVSMKLGQQKTGKLTSVQTIVKTSVEDKLSSKVVQKQDTSVQKRFSPVKEIISAMQPRPAKQPSPSKETTVLLESKVVERKEHVERKHEGIDHDPNKISSLAEKIQAKMGWKSPKRFERSKTTDVSSLLESKGDDKSTLETKKKIVSPLKTPEKPKKTPGLLPKSPDTNLDDLLSKNVEFLDDIDLDAPELKTPPSSSKKSSRTTSTRENPKTRKSLRKKVLKRSKSESDKSRSAGCMAETLSQTERSSKAAEDPGTRPYEKMPPSEEIQTKVETIPVSEPAASPVITTPGKGQQGGIQKSHQKAGDKERSRYLEGEDARIKKSSVPEKEKSLENLDEDKTAPVMSLTSHEDVLSSTIERQKKTDLARADFFKQDPIYSRISGEESTNLGRPTSIAAGKGDNSHLQSPPEAEPESSASNISDQFEQHKNREHNVDVLQDSTNLRTTTDSDSVCDTGSSNSLEGRKKRKDKSAARKSQLNVSSEDVSSRSEGQSHRIGVRASPYSPSSSLSKEEDTSSDRGTSRDPQKEYAFQRVAPSSQHVAPLVTTQATPLSTHNRILSPPTIHEPPSSGRAIHTTVLDSQSVLPSKFTMPSKVSSALSKFSQESGERSRESSPVPEKRDDQNKSPRKFARGKDFSSLLQKFSSSDASSSEKSDAEPSSPRRAPRFFIKRQEAFTATTSSDESNTERLRRTPERTQSLKIRASSSEEREVLNPVQRSGSFKSDFMRRRIAEQDVKGSNEQTDKQTDKPTEELASVLTDRNQIVTEQQQQGEQNERAKIHDRKTEKEERKSPVVVDEVIEDSEVVAALKARRVATDERTKTLEKTETKLDAIRKTEGTGHPDTSHSAISEAHTAAEGKLDISAIDACLAVLSVVSSDNSDSEKKVDGLQTGLDAAELASAVSRVNVESPTQVVQFIKDVQKSSLSGTGITSERSTANKSLPQQSRAVEQHTGVKEENIDSVLNAGKLSVQPETVVNVQDVKNKAELSSVSPRRNLPSISQVVEQQVGVPVEKVGSVSSSSGLRIQSETAPLKSLEKAQVQEVLTRYAGDMKVPESKVEKLEPVRAVEKATKSEPNVREGKDLRSTVLSKEREKTPDKILRSKFSPVKEGVVSPWKTPGTQSPGLTRTESVGRTESMEHRPRGILKRSPSLPKQSVIVDPELATVLQKRRQQVPQEEDEQEEIPAYRRLSAAEDIESVIRREKKTSITEEVEEEKEKRLSVAERIFQMHAKIEDTVSCPITPRAKSGSGTPRSALKARGGAWTPKAQTSIDETTLSPPVFSGDQLMEKLTSLADKGKTVTEKRRHFARRQRDDWRTRTQPVTEEEIHAADSLATVQSFRSEVMRRASRNVFEHMKDKEPQVPVTKKTEWPQPYRREKPRRPRHERHNTLPVTTAELNAIPEGQLIKGSLKSKADDFGNQDSRADSGILSGSDAESTAGRGSDSLRSLDGSNEDVDLTRMSVSAKAILFQQQIEEKSKTKLNASGAKRYIDRKKRERSRTQPVTEDEVKTAAEIADQDGTEAPQTAITAKVTPPETIREGSVELDDDDVSKRSLADKVKLFQNLKEAETKAPPKKDVQVIRRRNRKLASRFNTQPITTEEVAKASRISPLAMSLVKPPDPDLLAGLPLQAQIDLMAQHAEACLSQPTSRSGSRRGSADVTMEEKQETKGILKSVDHSREAEDIKGILKPEAVKSPDREIRGILKQDEEKHETVEPRSILKHLEQSELGESDVRSILKQSDADVTVKRGDSELRSIMKHGENENVQDELCKKGILKSDMLEMGSNETKSALRKDSCYDKVQEPKGILKKDSSFEVKKSEPEKGILRESHKDDKDVKNGELSPPRLRQMEKSPSPEESSVKRRSRDRKSRDERYLTQPAESTPEISPETRRKMKYTGRHLTQPVTPDEKKEAAASTDLESTSGLSGSIKDRLNSLKKSGDEEWKKRVSRPLDFDTPTKEVTITTEVVKLREKVGPNMPRPSSIADRLNQLQGSAEVWKGKVEESDAKKLTVEYRITAAGQSMVESPLVARLKKTPRKNVIRKEFSDDSTSESSELTSPVSTPTKESTKIPLPKEIISTGVPVPAESTSEDEKKEPVIVEIPSMDNEEFQAFFRSKDISMVTERVEATVDDFNEIFIIADQILPSTKKIRPKRKHAAKSRNPLKTMSMTMEVKTEYEQLTSGVAEKELKRMKREAIAKDSGFAIEALAGLASSENFSHVSLRKADTSTPVKSSGTHRSEPYHDLMLLHVKGRRRIQTRLVEPSASSINSGDCYILVMPDRVVVWCGEYSNVIEKAKAADVATIIQTKRDLGCKLAQTVTMVEEKKQNYSGKSFWGPLGEQSEYQHDQACGLPEEDELYESYIVETNMVYRLTGNSLVPCEEHWGAIPKVDMLQKDEVFVFDFGSELYVWQGTNVAMDKRKLGMKLAKQLWERGYDYSACDINPLCPLKTEDLGGLPMEANNRPPWALFGKVNQNMETILFREKFSDWPDASRLIGIKGQVDVGSKSDLSGLKAYDAKLMTPVSTSPVTMILEGSHVGRGTTWAEDMDGFIQDQIIQTLGVTVWHVLEYEHFKLPVPSFGQFHDGDTYVVRWQYMITQAGFKNRAKGKHRSSLTGRERCAYFFWQGKQSTINEKGASALMTVELDEERGPQVRVDEGKEPPCFLNVFKGSMIIHIGKREDESTNTQGSWRMYCVRSDYDNELCLMEIPAGIHNVRSRSSFILLNVNTGLLYIWHGAKSPQHVRKLTLAAAERLQNNCPLEVGLHEKASIVITEMSEEEEKLEFWRVMDVERRDRSQYYSLLEDARPFTHTPRLFHMSSVSGTFEVHEVLNPTRTADLHTPFPVICSDLYRASQPALFLLDNDSEVFLWQGWWPEGDAEEKNVITGSAQARFNVDRKCALETTVQYCKEKNSENPLKAYVVSAGLEPLQFTNLFPYWEVNEAARQINKRDGNKEGEIISVGEMLQQVTRTRYTLAELREGPAGVDPLRLESYLEDEEFKEILEMDKEEFYALPAWKQKQLKQQKDLF